MIWRAIPGFSAYEASSLGDVRRIGSEKALSSAVDGSTGYAKLTIYNDNRELKTVSVHRMVCSAFHGPPPRGAQACHRSGVKTANAALNLYWGSRHQNAADRRGHEGQEFGRFLGSLKTIKSIRKAYKSGKINKDRAISLIGAL